MNKGKAFALALSLILLGVGIGAGAVVLLRPVTMLSPPSRAPGPPQLTKEEACRIATDYVVAWHRKGNTDTAVNALGCGDLLTKSDEAYIEFRFSKASYSPYYSGGVYRSNCVTRFALRRFDQGWKQNMEGMIGVSESTDCKER